MNPIFEMIYNINISNFDPKIFIFFFLSFSKNKILIYSFNQIFFRFFKIWTFDKIIYIFTKKQSKNIDDWCKHVVQSYFHIIFTSYFWHSTCALPVCNAEKINKITLKSIKIEDAMHIFYRFYRADVTLVYSTPYLERIDSRLDERWEVHPKRLFI